jgi:hypothetical protein
VSGAACDSPFGTPEPGKAGVEHGDVFGGGLEENRGQGNGCGWWRGQQGAAEALVAPEGFAAAGAGQAQLQRSFVE